MKFKDRAGLHRLPKCAILISLGTSFFLLPMGIAKSVSLKDSKSNGKQ